MLGALCMPRFCRLCVCAYNLIMPYSYPGKLPRKSRFALRVGRSSAGLGLFAGEDIPRGAFVIEYFGALLANEASEKKGGKYLFYINRHFTIDGSSRNNLARYLNHACKPNGYAEQDGKRIFIYSRRRISKGEELTYNYGRAYTDEFIPKGGCACLYCKERRVRKRRA